MFFIEFRNLIFHRNNTQERNVYLKAFKRANLEIFYYTVDLESNNKILHVN